MHLALSTKSLTKLTDLKITEEKSMMLGLSGAYSAMSATAGNGEMSRKISTTFTV